MRVNNFKELEREEIRNIDPSIEKIKSNVNSNLGIFQLIGEMVEMFLPRLLNMIVSLTGGSSIDDEDDKKPSKYPNT